MPFRFLPQPDLPDVLRIEPVVRRDERGWFYEAFKQSEFTPRGIGPFVQENHSLSAQGTLRGLHYQLPPHAQGKLVRCVAGSLFDVAVDLRRGSATFGKHTSITLQPDGTMFWVPRGFAHGFQALEDGTEMVYHVDDEYAPKEERSIRFDDSALAITWPLADPRLAPKDAAAPGWADADIPERWT